MRIGVEKDERNRKRKTISFYLILNERDSISPKRGFVSMSLKLKNI